MSTIGNMKNGGARPLRNKLDEATQNYDTTICFNIDI
jgi:hypothetical protein